MLARISKALAGALTTGVGALVVAWPDGVTPEEWGKVAGALVVGFLGVYLAPKNAEPVPAAPEPLGKNFGPGHG